MLEHVSSYLAAHVRPRLICVWVILLEMLFVLLSESLGLVTDTVDLVPHYVFQSQAGSDSG